MNATLKFENLEVHANPDTIWVGWNVAARKFQWYKKLLTHGQTRLSHSRHYKTSSTNNDEFTSNGSTKTEKMSGKFHTTTYRLWIWTSVHDTIAKNSEEKWTWSHAHLGNLKCTVGRNSKEHFSCNWMSLRSNMSPISVNWTKRKLSEIWEKHPSTSEKTIDQLGELGKLQSHKNWEIWPTLNKRVMFICRDTTRRTINFKICFWWKINAN